MQLWRHTWDGNDWVTNPNFLFNLRSFGFVNSDGTELNEDIYTGTETNKIYQDIKWRYDPIAGNGKNVFQLTTYSPNPERWGGGGTATNNFTFHGINSTLYFCLNIEIEPNSYHGTSPTKTFFIPLKDNGFFLNFRKHDTRWDSHSDSEDYDPDGWQNYGQTPQLVTCGNTYAASDISNKSCQNLIALPSSQITSNGSFTYIAFAKNTRDNKQFINVGKGLDMTLNYHESITGQNGNHIDINQNTCTLIRYPYEGGFLDNVYIMTTSPTNFSDDVGFFTINGRNFMKPFENIVVELPSDD